MIIRAILVDDEEKALKSLAIKIKKLFPEIDVIAMTQHPEEAIDLINDKKPDLVFMDIEMPQLSGFEVIQKVAHPNFEIIFVTAYNEYAVEAVQCCAIGYVLKPIDNQELNKAVKNAIKSILLKNALVRNSTLIENLKSSQSDECKVIIPSQKGLDFIKINDIIRCEGEAGYTNIILSNNKKILSSYSIGKFVRMLHNKNFMSVHRSHLVNLKYVSGYLNEGYISMENGDHLPISKVKRQEFIERMSEL